MGESKEGEGGVKGIMGEREGWVGDIYGGDEGRDGYGRDMRGRWREDKYKRKGLMGGE